MIFATYGHKARFRLSKRLEPFALAFLFSVWTCSTGAIAQVETKTFSNAYISFDIPATWDCERDGAAFSCQENGVKKVSSVAILAAKLTDPSSENAAVFASELALQRTLKTQDGRTILSKPIDNRTRCIGGTQWQWGKQFQSELAGYFTEYFVALTKGITILVTISYHTSVEAEGREFARTLARHLTVVYQSTNTSSSTTDDSSCKSEQ